MCVYICIYMLIHNIYAYVYIYLYIYILYFFVCSILKHQLNADTLDKNGTCISNAVTVSSK